MSVFLILSVLFGIATITMLYWRNKLSKDFLHEMEFGQDPNHGYNTLKQSPENSPLWKRRSNQKNFSDSELIQVFGFFTPMSNYFGDSKKTLLAIALEKRFMIVSVLLALFAFLSSAMAVFAF